MNKGAIIEIILEVKLSQKLKRKAFKLRRKADYIEVHKEDKISQQNVYSSFSAAGLAGYRFLLVWFASCDAWVGEQIFISKCVSHSQDMQKINCLT